MDEQGQTFVLESSGHVQTFFPGMGGGEAEFGNPVTADIVETGPLTNIYGGAREGVYGLNSAGIWLHEWYH